MKTGKRRICRSPMGFDQYVQDAKKVVWPLEGTYEFKAEWEEG